MVLRDSRVFENLNGHEGGNAFGGGIYYTSGKGEQPSTLTLEDTEVVHNRAARGGGLMAGEDDVVTIVGGSFVDNTAMAPREEPNDFERGFGGGIQGEGATLTITGVTFDGNAADWGGGAISTGTYPTGGQLNVQDRLAGIDSVTPAVDEVDGGAVVTVTDSTFVDNGQFVPPSGSDDSTEFHTRTGGAIQTHHGDLLTVTGSSFAGNVVMTDDLPPAQGGAIETGGATTRIHATTFTNNHAVCDGFGVRTLAEVEDCPAFGGAISDVGPFGVSAQTLYVSSSSFVGNSASYGGALANLDVAYVTNATFVDNEAYVGGAIVNGGTLTLARTTVARNTAAEAESAGGLVEAPPSQERTTYLDHTVFAENTAGGDLRNCVEDGGTIVTEGHNVADDASCFADGEGSGDQAGVEAGLGSLDTSGPTSFVPLLTSSPAVDVDTEAAACPTATDDADADAHADEATRDQRGEAAPVDGDGDGTAGCDAGAFELAAPEKEPEDEDPEVASSRLAGDDRIDTAVLASQFSYPDGADTVVIARSDLYADALAGGPLAHDIEAPILVTPSTSLDPRVQAEIDRLGATRAIILGGPHAIAGSVEMALQDQAGVATDRLEGATRFETAVRVAEELGGDAVYVTEGDNPDPNRGWPDAVSVSSLAAHQGRAILFATTDTLPAVTRTHLQGVDGVTIVGGPNAVSTAVEDAIGAVTTVDDRIEGLTRHATAAAVADAAVAAGLTPDTLWAARGDNWVDALVAGPAVARAGDVFLLVPSDDLAQAPDVQAWITSHGDVIEQVRIMGGETAVSAVVEQQLLGALNP